MCATKQTRQWVSELLTKNVSVFYVYVHPLDDQQRMSRTGLRLSTLSLWWPLYSLASHCLCEYTIMLEKRNPAWLTMRERMEIQFAAQHDCRTSHTVYKTRKMPFVQNRMCGHGFKPMLVLLYRPIKITQWEGKRKWLRFKRRFVAILSWWKTWKWCNTLKYLMGSKKLLCSWLTLCAPPPYPIITV